MKVKLEFPVGTDGLQLVPSQVDPAKVIVPVLVLVQPVPTVVNVAV